MTLAKLQTMRDSIQAQYDAHVRNPAGPGQEATKHFNAIELLAAVRTCDQMIAIEKAELCAPPGATGPVLVGV